MSDWIKLAKTLKFGQRRKVKHCGTDISAYCSNGPKGVSLHCFRCEQDEFEPHGRLSAADILRYRANDDRAARATEYPTVIGLHDAPDPAKLWCLRAFIRPEKATDQYGMGYDAQTERVVVPILHNGQATGLWTARALDGRAPKYLMPFGSAGSMWYDTRRSGTIVICEDILSAARCAEAGYGAAAILGTAVGVQHLQTLETAAKDREFLLHVLGWFDADNAGRDAWVKLRAACGVLGLSPIRVQSDKDPKLHKRIEIQEKIGEALRDSKTKTYLRS